MPSFRARRVVHLASHLRLGMGRYVVDVAREQRRRYPDGVVVCVADDAEGNWCSDPVLLTELRDQGVAVEAGGDYFHRRLPALLACAARLRAHGWHQHETLFHAHTAMSAAVASWAGASRIVLTSHGWNPSRPPEYDLQDALALQRCHAVTTPSAWWAGQMMRVLGRSAEVVPVGVDLGRYPAMTLRPRSENLRIVSVAELTRRKGQDLLIDAMPAVWADRPDTELHLYGTGDAREEFEARARRIDETGARILFHGHVPEPYGRLHAFDLFAIASRADNQPVAVIEALLAGLPALGTRVGGIPDLLEPAGLLVEPNDAEALAAGILAFARMSHAERRAIGEQAERTARIRFDVNVAADAFEAIYNRED